MELPANLVRTLVSLTSNAVANGVNTGTLLAAPGANLRTRIWAFGAYPRDTAQAVANWYAAMTNGAGGTVFAAISGANFGGGTMLTIPGGFGMGTNIAIGWQLQSALAALSINLYVYTTTELA